MVLRHLLDLSLALALFALCAGVGSFSLGWFRVRELRAQETLLFGVPLGAGLLAVALLLLGALGLLQPGLMLGVLAAAGAVARRELIGLPRLLGRAWQEARRDGSGELGFFSAVVTGAAALFILAFALAPPSDWDSLMYHLRIPDQFLERGRVFLPEDNLRVSYVNLIHMLYLPFLAAGSEAAPAILNALFALLLAVGVFSCAARLFPGPSAALSTALLWSTTIILIVAPTARVDVTVALFVFAGHYALLVAWNNGDRGAFYLCALLLGLAVGVKFHALPYILALGPAVLLASARLYRGPAVVKAMAGFALLGVAGAAPWLAKNAVLLGAPFYPLLAHLRFPPWIETVLSGPLDPESFRIIRESRVPFNLRDALLSPGKLSIESEGSFYFSSPAFLLLPGALLVRSPAVALLALPALGYLVLLLLPFPLTNLRYLLPAVPALTVVTGHVAARVLARFRAQDLARGAAIVLGVAALIPTMHAARTWVGRTAITGYLAGRASAEQYAGSHFLPHVAQFAPVTRFLNDSLPADATVLMLFESRGFGLRPRVIEDHTANFWPVLAGSEAVRGCLAGTGVTHVLINVGAARYYADRGVDRSRLRLDDFTGFADRCLAAVHRTPAHQLYRLR